MYNFDGLKTSHNHDFMLDSEFLEAYTFASNLIGKITNGIGETTSGFTSLA